MSAPDSRRAEIRSNGRKFYAAGTNCYELFFGSLRFGSDGMEFDLADSFETLDPLKAQGVRIVRFDCGVYYASELSAYLNRREEYLGALRQIAAEAERLEIGLVPSLIWHFAAVPDHFGEPFRSWGDSRSRTVDF